MFISNWQKCHVSLIIIYVFSSTKSENRRQNRFFWGVGVEMARKGVE
jgi:hypothetical protein